MLSTVFLLTFALGRQDLVDLFAEESHELGWRQREAPYNCTSATKTGYLKNQAGKYLTCTNEDCSWQAFSSSATQLFHQVPAGRGRRSKYNSKFEIYSPSGAPTGQCLNFFKEDGITPKIRMASCDMHSSQRWSICTGFLGIFGMRECVQSNAQVAPCKQSHEVVTLESPKCIITSTTIDHLECMSPVTGGGCAATGFEAGTTAGAASQSDCDACYAAKGSSQQCSFSFAYTTQNTVTNTWSNAFTWDIGVSFSLQENFLYGSASQGLSFSFSDTLTVGKSKTVSTTVQDTTGCSVTLPSGVRETATANYLVGTIHANFNATVTRHWTCNTGLHKKPETYADTMKLTITNVPTQKIVGSCMTIAKPCDIPEGGNAPTNPAPNNPPLPNPVSDRLEQIFGNL